MIKSYFSFVAIVFVIGVYAGYNTPTLEERVGTLERNYAACCGTETRDYTTEQHLAAYIALKRRVDELEQKVKKMEKHEGEIQWLERELNEHDKAIYALGREQ